MPHLILSTTFPRDLGSPAEVTFYGPVEPDAVHALKQATQEALPPVQQGSVASGTPISPAGPGPPWQTSSTELRNATSLHVRIPGSWEHRRVLGNMLRVKWLDCLEHFGWAVRACVHDRKPGSLLEGIETDLVVYDMAEPPIQGETANFLLFKGSTGTEHDALNTIVSAAMCDRPLAVHSHPPSSESENGDAPARRDSIGGSESGRQVPGSPSKASGLTLPEVVHRLLREPQALRWDSMHRYFEVIDGAVFEKKFNELRKTRQRHKDGAVERPFSRMHNFFVLEKGEKWAKTGTIFRPKEEKHFPKEEDLENAAASSFSSSSTNIGSSPSGKGEVLASAAVAAIQALSELQHAAAPATGAGVY